MKLYLILMAVGVVLSLLQIVTSGWAGLATAIIQAVIQAYFFICIYSLYQMIKGDGGNATPY
jgi:prepilin signal peptidase PulO-like enzyme (type II secretory pathway)